MRSKNKKNLLPAISNAQYAWIGDRYFICFSKVIDCLDKNELDVSVLKIWSICILIRNPNNAKFQNANKKTNCLFRFLYIDRDANKNKNEFTIKQ